MSKVWVDRELLLFLNGEAGLYGMWFGEHPPGKPFWWRKYLRKALAQPAEAEGEFGAEQWWFAELDAALSSGTVDQRRSLAVVRNLVGQFAAMTAERDRLASENEALHDVLENVTIDRDGCAYQRDQLRAEVEALRAAITPQVFDWVRCGLGVNGWLVGGTHPALEKLRDAMAAKGR